jgi:hypothetical protein
MRRFLARAELAMLTMLMLLSMATGIGGWVE